MDVSVGLAAASLLALMLGSWPFGPYQLTLILARKLHRFPRLPAFSATNTAAHEETFAVCLCVYNERAVIRQKVEDLLRLRAASGGKLDILIYTDGSDDGTTEILREYGERIDLLVSSQRRGKTNGMNLLVNKTTASIVAFTDANVLISPDAVQVLRCYFSDPQVGCVCSDLTYMNAGDSATASVGARYWRINEWSKSLETSTGSVIGADGSLFAIRRALHRPVPKGLFDDLYVSLSVLLQGYRVVRSPELKAYETHTTKANDEYRRKVRIACECMHVHFTLWPELRQLNAWNLYKYVGHRFLRWMSGCLFFLGGLLAAGAIWAAAGPFWGGCLPLVVWLMFLLTVMVGLRPSLKLWNVMLAFLGTSVGVWRAVQGQRSITWNAPESARQATLVAPNAGQGLPSGPRNGR